MRKINFVYAVLSVILAIGLVILIFLGNSSSWVQLSKHDSLFSFKRPYGTAYVVTRKSSLSHQTIEAITALGFQAKLFQAVSPFSMQAINADIQGKLVFGPAVKRHKSLHPNLSLGEIAKIASYRKVFKAIAEDASIRDSAWSLIIFNDIQIHPLVADKAYSIVGDVLNSQHWDQSYGLVYFGSCSPICKSYSNEDPAAGATYGQMCDGYCLNAFAITKRRAKTLFQELYCDHSLSSCGCPLSSSCEVERVLQAKLSSTREEVEQEMLSTSSSYQSSSKTPLAAMICPSLRSPYHSNYFGIIYPVSRKSKRRTAKSAVNVYEDCFDVEYEGNIGSLMSQYASLIGICVSRGFRSDSCAALSSDHQVRDSPNRPIKELRMTFPTYDVSCVKDDVAIYREITPFKPLWSIRFDVDVFNQSVGTKILGPLKSFKYFHPHGESIVRRVYQFPSSIAASAKIFIDFVRGKVHGPLTCVHIPPERELESLIDYFVNALIRVRNETMSKSSSIATEYSGHRGELNIVFFVEGSLSTEPAASSIKSHLQVIMTKHYLLVDKSLSRLDTVTYQPTDMNHVKSIAAITQCDNIVVSSSMIGWWGAYLAVTKGLVIAPLLKGNPDNARDMYPDSWIVL